MKKSIKKAIFIALLVVPFLVSAQEPKASIDKSKLLGQGTKSEIFTAELYRKVNSPSGDLEWLPTLTSKVVKIKHGLPGEEETEAMKAEKWLLKEASMASKIGGTDDGGDVYTGSTPVVGEDFLGNVNNGSSPMDNSIAISDDGFIVSVANTTIQYKSTSGSTIYSNSILDFIDDPDVPYVCDPVVLYDPEADRFIFFAQECVGSSDNTSLIIMFSETNDPTDGWNYYRLTGDPLDDNSWFDYPKLAISDGELFITGNLFSDSFFFREPVVYQMNKEQGYDGVSMDWQVWSDIPGSPGTILVVSSGNEVNYGPGIYMVSTSPFSGNTIRFYEITDEIGAGAELDYYSVSTSSYSVAADAPQLGTSCLLDNGDCRPLSGFYLDGTVHFVFQSDIGSGWNSINYNRLDVASLTNTSDKFGDAGNMDYSYPSIAWFGTSPTDKTVAIGFGSVSNSEYPQVRAVICNNDMEWSETTLVKESDDYACFTGVGGGVERWGDYTGTARRHNSPEPSVWMNGMFGTNAHRWNTWIAEIHTEFVTGISEAPEQENILIAPNPFVETFILSFDSNEDIPVNVRILGIDGKVVKDLYSGMVRVGENKFAFNKANLASGTYFLQIVSEDKQIANEKIVIN